MHPKGAEISQAALQCKPTSVCVVAQTPSAFASSVLGADVDFSVAAQIFPGGVMRTALCLEKAEPVAADLGVSLGFDYLFEKPSISLPEPFAGCILPDRHASCFCGSFTPDSIRFSLQDAKFSLATLQKAMLFYCYKHQLLLIDSKLG